MPGTQSPAHAALGRAIRALRNEQNLSQEDLAHRSGLDRTYAGGVERGERNLGLTNLLRIAEALDIRPSELLAAMEREQNAKRKR